MDCIDDLITEGNRLRDIRRLIEDLGGVNHTLSRIEHHLEQSIAKLARETVVVIDGTNAWDKLQREIIQKHRQ